jgi:hypothetical protein
MNEDGPLEGNARLIFYSSYQTLGLRLTELTKHMYTFFFFLVLGIEPRALHMLVKHSITELCTQSLYNVLKFQSPQETN